MTQAPWCNGTSCVSPCFQVAVLDTGLDEHYKTNPAFEGITVVGRNFTTKDVFVDGECTEVIDVSVRMCYPFVSRLGSHNPSNRML
jgi:hypothetical protein